MKSKKIVLLSFSLLLLVFSSCNKEDKDTVDPVKKEVNRISINGKPFDVNVGLKKKISGYYAVVFSTEGFGIKDFSGTLSFLEFLINVKEDKLLPGTYNYSSDDSPDYDPSIHFFDALAGENIVVENGTPDFSGENYFEDIIDGEIKVEKIGENYKFKFDMNFENASIIGNYEGTIVDKTN